jgi:hypothetical protein
MPASGIDYSPGGHGLTGIRYHRGAKEQYLAVRFKADYWPVPVTTPPPIRPAAEPGRPTRGPAVGPAAAHLRLRSPLCASPCAGPPRSSLPSSRNCPFIRPQARNDRGRHALLRTTRGCSRLFRTTPRQESDGPAPRSKARPHSSRQAVREPGPSDPLNATAHNRNAYPNPSIRRFSAGISGHGSAGMLVA